MNKQLKLIFINAINNDQLIFYLSTDYKHIIFLQLNALRKITSSWNIALNKQKKCTFQKRLFQYESVFFTWKKNLLKNKNPLLRIICIPFLKRNILEKSTHHIWQNMVIKYFWLSETNTTRVNLNYNNSGHDFNTNKIMYLKFNSFTLFPIFVF